MLCFFKMNLTEFDTHTKALFGRLVPSITVTFRDILVLATVWDLWFAFDIYKDSKTISEKGWSISLDMWFLQRPRSDESFYKTLVEATCDWTREIFILFEIRKAKVNRWLVLQKSKWQWKIKSQHFFGGFVWLLKFQHALVCLL